MSLGERARRPESGALLHEGLVAVAPTMGARVGRAAAVAEAQGPGSGWRLLETIPRAEAATYQPYWAVAAHLLKALDRTTEAIEAYELAIGLCEDPGTRDWLQSQVPRREARYPNQALDLEAPRSIIVV